MSLTRNSLSVNVQHVSGDVVEALRNIALSLADAPDSKTRTVLFTGWHEGYEEEDEQLIKHAARAILASGIELDEGTHVPLVSVAAILHYIADMME